jgi:hypothetical protein
MGLIAAAAATSAYAGNLRAGASKLSITPVADEFPCQIGREKPFVGVHDDLFVRALVLQEGERRIVIVSAEVTAIPNGRMLVERVAAAAQVPTSRVMLLASHTHNSLFVFYRGTDVTNAQRQELERLESNAVKAVRDAIDRLEPAKISFGRGAAYANINNGEEAGLKQWFDGAGSSDKSLDVIRVQATDGKTLALVLNYATHAEVMYRSITKDGGYEVSGDLPGATSRLLEQTLALAPVVLFTSAAEGDQLSLFKSLQPNAQLPGMDAGAAGWSLLELQARRIASAVVDTLSMMPQAAEETSIATAAGDITCPGAKRTIDPAGQVMTQSAADVVIPVSVFRINDFAVAAISADLASDIGVAIKQASPVRSTTIATMAADSVGYVLNDAAYERRGHAMLGSPVKPGCAPVRLPERVSELLRSAH